MSSLILHWLEYINSYYKQLHFSFFLPPFFFIPCKSVLWEDFAAYQSRLLNLGTVDIWGQIPLCCGDRPVQCRIVTSIRGLTPPDVSRLPILCPQSISRPCQMPPEEGAKWSLVKTTPADTGTFPGLSGLKSKDREHRA